MADLVVLASGSGTNFEAIARAFAGDSAVTPHHVRRLITDNPEAGALSRAERLGIPTTVVDYRAGRIEAESRLRELLVGMNPDLIVLAGFMKVLPASIVDRFPRRILNIHPSLLPDFPGLRAIERSYAVPGGPMGITIHVVDRGVDTGPVLARVRAQRSGDETLEEMEARIHRLEHEHYPRVIAEQADMLEAVR